MIKCKHACKRAGQKGSRCMKWKGSMVQGRHANQHPRQRHPNNNQNMPSCHSGIWNTANKICYSHACDQCHRKHSKRPDYQSGRPASSSSPPLEFQTVSPDNLTQSHRRGPGDFHHDARHHCRRLIVVDTVLSHAGETRGGRYDLVRE